MTDPNWIFTAEDEDEKLRIEKKDVPVFVFEAVRDHDDFVGTGTITGPHGADVAIAIADHHGVYAASLSPAEALTIAARLKHHAESVVAERQAVS